jgi:hypothetical protein
MGKRRSDYATRRFFDEFPFVRVSRFRAMGTIDPTKNHALIPFPNGKTKLIGAKHTRFRNGGGWSYFVCPKCANRTPKLYLIEDAPLCSRCCEAMGLRHRSRYGFGRAARREEQDKHLDELIAKLESSERLRLKPAPASWGGRAQKVYCSRRLTDSMRRRMITLRLNQLAYQQSTECAEDDDILDTMRPRPETRDLIDVSAIWRANTAETLSQALDKAQTTILSALNSNDPKTKLNAVKLMLNTKQARDRGL